MPRLPLKIAVCSCALALLCSTNVSYGQHIVWRAYETAGNGAEKAGHLPKSLMYYHKALGEAQREGYAISIIESASKIGEVSYRLGQFADSEEAYRLAMKVFEDHYHPDAEDATTLAHHDVVSVLNGLAAAQQRQQKYADAEQNLRHAIRLLESRHERNDNAMVHLLNGLAHAAYHQRDLVAADAIVAETLMLAGSTIGHDDPIVADTRTLQAVVLAEEGDFESAAGVATEAIATIEKAFGPNNPRAAHLKILLSRLHHRRGAKEQAQVAASGAVDTLKQHLHDAHPDLAHAIQALQELDNQPIDESVSNTSGQSDGQPE